MKKRSRSLPALAGFLRDVRAGVVGLPSVMLSLIILMGVAGVSDLVSLYHNRSLLQAAMDAGSIAAGKKLSGLDSDMSDDEVGKKLKPVIERYILANLPEGIRQQVKDTVEISFTSDRDKGIVSVVSEAELENASIVGAQFWGPVTHKVAFSVTSQHAVVPVDLVLAIDSSVSMWGDRIQNVKGAAEVLIDTLSHEDKHVSIGLVPYNTTVNIGTSRQAWVRDVGQGHKANTALPGPFGRDFGPWQGCIEHRAKANDLDLSLVTPDVEPFTSWFSPNSEYYRPDERIGRVVGDNDWSVVTVQKLLNRGVGPHKGCPDPIIPLTKNFDRVKKAVENMTIPWSDGTQPHVGVVWGRRLLADSWRNLWALPSKNGGPKRKKVLVLLSDGASEMNDVDAVYPGVYPNNPGGSYTSEYSGYGRTGTGSPEEGYLRDGRMWNMASEKQAVDVLDELFEESCKRAKKDGIILFTVSAVPNANDDVTKKLQGLLSRCATSKEHVFVANSTQERMADAFREIVSRLVQLRLVK